jgi:hypothetical protein
LTSVLPDDCSQINAFFGVSTLAPLRTALAF